VSETIEQPTDLGTALAVLESTNLALIFTPGGVEKTVSAIERGARAEAAKLDPSTEAGRKALTSLGYKIARSKTAMDNAGKELNEGKRAEINMVDADRRVGRERLDDLKAEIIKPVEEYKAKLAEIDAANEGQIALIENLAIGLDDLTPDEIKARYMGSRTPFPWAIHFTVRAERTLKGVQAQLQVAHQAAKQRVADAEAEALRVAEEAEAQRLAAIEAQRIREERIAAEAAEAARVAAEAKAAREAEERAAAVLRAQEEAERLAQAERDAAARREQEAADALASAAARERHAIEVAEQVAARANTKRIADHEASIASMRQLAVPVTTPQSVAVLDVRIAQLIDIYEGREWEEFSKAAEDAFNASSAVMDGQRVVAVAWETAEVERLAKVEQEAADARAVVKQKAQQAIADKQAADREKNVANQKRVRGDLVADIMQALQPLYAKDYAENVGQEAIAIAVMNSLVRKEIRHVGPVIY
jgi:colicin import membrane protein